MLGGRRLGGGGDFAGDFGESGGWSSKLPISGKSGDEGSAATPNEQHFKLPDLVTALTVQEPSAPMSQKSLMLAHPLVGLAGGVMQIVIPFAKAASPTALGDGSLSDSPMLLTSARVNEVVVSAPPPTRHVDFHFAPGAPKHLLAARGMQGGGWLVTLQGKSLLLTCTFSAGALHTCQGMQGMQALSCAQAARGKTTCHVPCACGSNVDGCSQPHAWSWYIYMACSVLTGHPLQPC